VRIPKNLYFVPVEPIKFKLAAAITFSQRADQN
jgi:hypothetical protein